MVTASVETEGEEGNVTRIFSIPVVARARSQPCREAPAAEVTAASKPGAASRGAASGRTYHAIWSADCVVMSKPAEGTPTPESADSTVPGGAAPPSSGGRVDVSDLSMRRLHPLLQSQLRELRARVTGGRVSAHELLEMLSRYYDTVDDERRAMVRSMQLMSDEARSLGVEIAEQGAAQLQVILDHIKDVVITANAEGVIDRANPMTERVFAYPPGELLGSGIDVLVPGIADGRIDRRRARAGWPARATPFAACASSPEITARRSDGTLFPAEIAVSRARHGRSEVFVICLRDISERHMHAGSAARQRGALPLAGRQRTGGDHRHRSRHQALRRGQRAGAAPVQDDARATAGLAPRCGQRRDAARRAAGHRRRAST